MTKDTLYQQCLKELKPMILTLQAALELFGEKQTERLAKTAIEKYAIDRFVRPYENIPLEKRWQTFRDNLIANADGKVYTIEESSENMIRAKFIRCLFLEIFREFGLERFVPIYCQTDHITAQLIHPNLTFRRTQTLAEGASFCNHQWIYNEP